MELTRRDLLKGAAAATAGAATFRAPSIFVRRLTQASAQDNTIKVGILHSLSGTIAIIERSLHNAELLAIAPVSRPTSPSPTRSIAAANRSSRTPNRRCASSRRRPKSSS